MNHALETRVSLAFLAVLLVVCATTLVEGQKPPSPAVPPLPFDLTCCLAQFHQTTKAGDIEFKLDNPHLCEFLKLNQKTAQGTNATIVLPRLEPGKCDQTKDYFQKGPLTLKARGGIIYRDDGLAHFVGGYTITSPAKVAFKGRLECSFRIGTHTAPIGSEDCAPKNHLEGWLVGEGAKSDTLRAMLALRFEGQVPFPGQVKLSVTGAVLNGVLTHCK